MSKNHVVAGILGGAKVFTNKGGVWVETLKDSLERMHLNYQHNMPSREDLHLADLKVQFATVDACNAATKLGNGLVDAINEIVEER